MQNELTKGYISKGFYSREFACLFEDIRLGKVNTVFCTALDRISSSSVSWLVDFITLPGT